MGTVMQTHYKSPFPALNVKRRNEDLYTDTVYADTPAIDDGSTSAQFFVGRDTGIWSMYQLRTSLCSDFLTIQVSGKQQWVGKPNVRIFFPRYPTSLLQSILQTSWTESPDLGITKRTVWKHLYCISPQQREWDTQYIAA